jgi:hypothetical protein
MLLTSRCLHASNYTSMLACYPLTTWYMLALGNPCTYPADAAGLSRVQSLLNSLLVAITIHAYQQTYIRNMSSRAAPA